MQLQEENVHICPISRTVGTSVPATVSSWWIGITLRQTGFQLPSLDVNINRDDGLYMYMMQPILGYEIVVQEMVSVKVCFILRLSDWFSAQHIYCCMWFRGSLVL